MSPASGSTRRVVRTIEPERRNFPNCEALNDSKFDQAGRWEIGRRAREFAQFGIENSGQVRRLIANGGPQLSANGHRLPRLRRRSGREGSVGQRHAGSNAEGL